MTDDGKPNFLYLNRDNQWADFEWRNLDLGEDGSLRLASLPALEGSLPEMVATLSPPSAPAGIAACPEGTIYFSDPSMHFVRRIDPCEGRAGPLPCSGGKGSLPSQLREPRGLAWHAKRGALLVADSLNHRILLLNPDDGHVLGIWGQPHPPQAGSDPGLLDRPTALAADSHGNLYVVDADKSRIQKFDLNGQGIPSFWERVKEQSPWSRPSEVAVSGVGTGTEVYVFDQALSAVLVFDQEGRLIRQPQSLRPLQQPMGFAVNRDALYLGDNARRRVLKFRHSGEYVGEAQGYAGPVAALALDGEGGLWVHPGAGTLPLRLALSGAFVRGQTRGILWGGPFENRSSRDRQWHRLKIDAEPLPTGTHLQLYIHSSPNVSRRPPAPIDTAGKFDSTAWKKVDAADVLECLFPGSPLDLIWIGAELSSSGQATPVLSQMRLDFDHVSYVRHLPPIYLEDETSYEFLLRFLSLFQSQFDDIEGGIENLSALFDPEAIPQHDLPWLANCVAADLDDTWPEEKKRQAIAMAFSMHAARGTRAGLHHALRFYAGVDARIEEPLSHAAWWALPATEDALDPANQQSTLEFTTMLAAAEPQGAVLGTTAILDQSHVITAEEFGAPLFADLAHRFLVQLHRGQTRCAGALQKVREIVEREKPAHTDFHLCILEPRMRIGFQARVGVDTIVASPVAQVGGHMPVPELVLAGEPPGRIGAMSRIGKTTRLDEAALRD